MRILFFLLISLFLFMACEELPCSDNDGVKVNLGFYTISEGAIADTSLSNFQLTLLTDPVPYTELYDTKEQALSFPLNPNADSCTAIILYDDETADTLVFFYERNLSLVNHECEFDVFFDISNVETTSKRLDSVWIRKPEVEFGDYENVKVYF